MPDSNESDVTGAGLDELIAHGRDLLKQGRPAEALLLFREAATSTPGFAEVWEGVGDCGWWLHDEAITFEGRETAYRIYRERDDPLGAARVATAIALDSLEFRGQPAVAQGWLRTARRLLVGGHEASAEFGWMLAWEAHLTLMISNDPKTAKPLAEEAVAIGRKLELIDLEMTALAFHGLALLTSGDVGEGMKRLDEAAAAVVSGDMMDRSAMATVICYLMDGCDRVRDYDRAAQWCARAKELGEMMGLPELVSFCRPHYAVVLMWRGDWTEAEAQLETGHREIMAFRPPMAVEGIVRLAELRWRQGRWDESQALFEEVKNEDLAQPGRGELALSEGHAEQAADLARTYLRRLPTEDRLERAPALDLLVRAQVACRGAEDAAPHVEELERIARHSGTNPMRAYAALARGVLEHANGNDDSARVALEDAVDFFEKDAAPFEAGRAQLRLSDVLLQMGRREPAAAAAAAALQAFRRIGASREAERAVAILGDLGAAPPQGAVSNPDGLTAREVEVLALIARGKTNQEIADELVLSIRTVERHISSIYDKVGTSGRSARAVVTAYALGNGIS